MTQPAASKPCPRSDKVSAKKDIIVALIIFACTFGIFLTSPVRQLADSQYSMLLSESLLHHRSFELDNYVLPRLGAGAQTGNVSNRGIYQLEQVNGHVYYFFPPGSSILSLPYVAVMNCLGISAANPDGTFNLRGEGTIEAGLAALLMSGLAALFFITGRLLLPLGWSVVLALAGALGTQVWSTASRALWSDTWGIFLLGFVVWMMLAHETGKHRLRPVLLATLLSWTYFVRPTFSLAIAAITAYLLVFCRHLLLPYALTGALWLAAFVFYSWQHFGQLVPSYYRPSRLSPYTFWMALAANAISPSRGLLVFVPVLLFVFYLLIRNTKWLASGRLAVLALSVAIAHLIVVSGFPHWWAGHSYGPRYTTGLVPWFMLLGILGVAGWLRQPDQTGAKWSSRARRAEAAAGITLLVCSFAINAMGANAHHTWLWNSRPVNIDDHPERVWDWRHPQFLAG
jgi:hypothetical protein